MAAAAAAAGGSGGKANGKTKTVYTYYQTDVTVGEAGGTLSPSTTSPSSSSCPAPTSRSLVYLGHRLGRQQALFLVSKDVTSVGGNGTCFPTADDCQLLGLSAGAGADLLYGPDGKTYHVQVTQIKRVTSSKPPA